MDTIIPKIIYCNIIPYQIKAVLTLLRRIIALSLRFFFTKMNAVNPLLTQTNTGAVSWNYQRGQELFPETTSENRSCFLELLASTGAVSWNYQRAQEPFPGTTSEHRSCFLELLANTGAVSWNYQRAQELFPGTTSEHRSCFLELLANTGAVF